MALNEYVRIPQLPEEVRVKTHLLVQVLEAFVLGCEAALGSDIHNHDDFTLERAEVELFSAEVLNNEIKQRLWHFSFSYLKGKESGVFRKQSDVRIKLNLYNCKSK